MLNAVINEFMNNKALAVDVEILDYKQCFDSMWMEAGIKDDKLSLIYQINQEVKVAVKTPFGL